MQDWYINTPSDVDLTLIHIILYMKFQHVRRNNSLSSYASSGKYRHTVGLHIQISRNLGGHRVAGNEKKVDQ